MPVEVAYSSDNVNAGVDEKMEVLNWSSRRTHGDEYVVATTSTSMSGGTTTRGLTQEQLCMSDPHW